MKWLLAVLLAVMSLADLLVPSVYARETTGWMLQGKGQDWFDLLVVVPLLVIAALRSRNYRWRVVLAGIYAFAVYELCIYAFAIHFGPLFLIYCATLGLAAFALLAVIAELSRERHQIDRRGAKLAGGTLIGIGVLFGLLWLAQDIPAMLAGKPPADVPVTNPVHVLDLSFVLPAHILAGVWVWHRRSAGELYAPILLAFGVLMAASIGGMLVAIRVMGGDAAMPVAIAMFVVAALEAAVLLRVLYPRMLSATAPIHAH